jgi:hypothetical protein
LAGGPREVEELLEELQAQALAAQHTAAQRGRRQLGAEELREANPLMVGAGGSGSAPPAAPRSLAGPTIRCCGCGKRWRLRALGPGLDVLRRLLPAAASLARRACAPLLSQAAAVAQVLLQSLLPWVDAGQQPQYDQQQDGGGQG